MINRDALSHTSIAKVVGPVTLSADNTPASIDLQGFRSAMIHIDVGVGGITFTGTNRIDFILSHSDDDVTFTPVTDEDIEGVTVANGILLSLTAAHAAATSYLRGYVGGRRYLRCLVDFGGTHATGTPIAVNIIRGHPTIAPIV